MSVGVILASLAAPAALAFDDDISLIEQAALEVSLSETIGESQPLRLFPQIEFTLTAGVWLTRVGGDAALGTGNASVTLEEEGFDLRDLEATFLGELEVRKADMWSVMFTGFEFSTSGGGVFDGNAAFGDITLTPGTPFTGAFELTSYSAEVSIGVFRPFAHLAGRPIDLSLSPMFVARWVDADIAITAGGTTASDGGEWLGALAGIRFQIELHPDSELFLISGTRFDASFALGPALGSDGGLIWQVRAGVAVPITPNIAFNFGYRLVDLSVENGPLELETQLAGLFIGGSIEF